MNLNPSGAHRTQWRPAEAQRIVGFADGSAVFVLAAGQVRLQRFAIQNLGRRDIAAGP